MAHYNSATLSKML